jgi:HAD superfamily hydrolase (TIGR01509 family)
MLPQLFPLSGWTDKLLYIVKFPRKPAGVIFDMDGLLLDTIPVYIEAMVVASAEIGRSISGDYLRSLIGLLGKELQNRLADDLGKDFPVQEFLHKTGEHLACALKDGAPLKSGAVELIEHLAALRLPLAIATSMQKQEAVHLLETARIGHFFSEVVGRDEVKFSKPHPDLYLKAALHLQLQPGVCIALEDSFNGIKSAYSAGCMTIMIPDVVAPTSEIEALCLGIATDLHQVKTWFLTYL